MESLDRWKVRTQLTIKEAALILANVDPEKHRDVDTYEPHQIPDGYNIYSEELKEEILSGNLFTAEAIKNMEPYFQATGYLFDQDNTDLWIPKEEKLDCVKIYVSSISRWLHKKNIKHSFFPPEKNDNFDVLNTEGEFYSYKLASALKAWKAVVDEMEKYKGRTPRQAIDFWLRKHAKELNIPYDGDTGEPVISVIENITSVANWDAKGIKIKSD